MSTSPQESSIQSKRISETSLNRFCLHACADENLQRGQKAQIFILRFFAQFFLPTEFNYMVPSPNIFFDVAELAPTHNKFSITKEYWAGARDNPKYNFHNF
jgi:hypothetical protein